MRSRQVPPTFIPHYARDHRKSATMQVWRPAGATSLIDGRLCDVDPSLSHNFSYDLVMPPPFTAARSVVTIEPMVPDDWPDVSSIYIEGIATGNATFETLAPTWEVWDRDHLPFARLVARLDGAIAGWAALARRSRRMSFAGVAELSVYVAAWARGKRVGSKLIEMAIKESEKFGTWTLQGSIIRGNEASLKMVEAAGFRQVGHRERIGKINGQWKDTILVERRSKVVGVD